MTGQHKTVADYMREGGVIGRRFCAQDPAQPREWYVILSFEPRRVV